MTKRGPAFLSSLWEGIVSRVKLTKWVCSVCGYEYDPTTGDPGADVAPETAFEDLPKDWGCPVCAVGKNEFEEM